MALAVRVDRTLAPPVRGILMESGAYDVRSVEGRFISRGMGPERNVPAGRGTR